MSNATEDGLRMALSSPDPVVRNLAIRREELLREGARLDQFLTAYAYLSNGEPLVMNGPVVATAARPKTPEEFVDALTKIIMAHGRPMAFAALREAYFAQYGAEAEQNFRKRLKRREDLIVLVNDHGYWPAGRPIPEGLNGVASDLH